MSIATQHESASRYGLFSTQLSTRFGIDPVFALRRIVTEPFNSPLTNLYIA